MIIIAKINSIKSGECFLVLNEKSPPASSPSSAHPSNPSFRSGERPRVKDGGTEAWWLPARTNGTGADELLEGL